MFCFQDKAANAPCVTKVQPFSFDKRPQRVRSRSVEPPDLKSRGEECHKPKRARPPPPHFGVPVLLPKVAKSTTELHPFSFDRRDQDLPLRRQERIDRVLEEERRAREFRARPTPSMDQPVGLPIKEVQLPTQSRPFNLEIERRVEARVAKWEKEVQEELRRQREAAAGFRAHPAKVLENPPFVPSGSDRAPTEITNFELHSDRRAKDREAFDMHRKHREAEIDARKRQVSECLRGEAKL